MESEEELEEEVISPPPYHPLEALHKLLRHANVIFRKKEHPLSFLWKRPQAALMGEYIGKAEKMAHELLKEDHLSETMRALLVEIVEEATKRWNPALYKGKFLLLCERFESIIKNP